MRLTAKLAKLEKASGKGERCAVCRLILRHYPPRPGRTLPGRLVTCPRCGTKYHQEPPPDLADDAEVKTRISVLYGSFEPDQFFTDRRARAVYLWSVYREYREISDASRGIVSDSHRSPARTHWRAPKSKVDRETEKARQRRAALIEEARAILRREDSDRKRRLGLRFPDLEALKARLGARQLAGRADHFSFDRRVEASRWLAFAKLEKVIFSEVSPETSERVLHWLAEYRAAKPEKLKRRRDALKLAEINRERAAAGLREYYSLGEAELERQAAERAAMKRWEEVEEAQPQPTPAPPALSHDSDNPRTTAPVSGFQRSSVHFPSGFSDFPTGVLVFDPKSGGYRFEDDPPNGVILIGSNPASS